MPAVAVIVAVLLGLGTSFAAESSLPGDALYGLKVNVNESVRGWLAVSDQAEVEWNIHRLERRLEETSQLAGEGRLDADIAAQLEANFEAYADRAEERIDRLKVEGNAHAALEASNEFESSLRAHEAILSRVQARSTGAVRAAVAGLRQNAAAELQAVLDAQASVEQAADAEAEAKGKAEVDVKARVEALMDAAEDRLSDAQESTQEVKAQIDAELSAGAQARLDHAQQAYLQAKSDLEANAYAKAQAGFRESQRLAQEAEKLAEGALEARLELETEGEAQTEVNHEREEESTSSESSLKLDASGSGRGELDLGL